MKAGEGYQVDCKLPEIRVQLAWEPQAASNTTHGCRDEMVQITNWNSRKRPE
jgi:hypothetical protein